MSNFPKLIPAFTCFVVLEAPIGFGYVSKGAPLTVAPFARNAGSLRSEPSYPIQVDATFVQGSDYIRQDPSGDQVRLEVNSVLKDTSGALIKFTYSGIVTLTSASSAILLGKGQPKTTDFGDALTHVIFETGSDKLKGLEQKIFVASGRFVVEEGKPLTVEYKISQLAA